MKDIKKYLLPDYFDSFACKMGIGWMSEHRGTDTLVDVAAAAFRLIEHTEFDRYAGPILKQLGCDDRAHLYNILCL